MSSSVVVVRERSLRSWRCSSVFPSFVWCVCSSSCRRSSSVVVVGVVVVVIVVVYVVGNVAAFILNFCHSWKQLSGAKYVVGWTAYLSFFTILINALTGILFVSKTAEDEEDDYD